MTVRDTEDRSASGVSSTLRLVVSLVVAAVLAIALVAIVFGAWGSPVPQ